MDQNYLRMIPNWLTQIIIEAPQKEQVHLLLTNLEDNIHHNQLPNLITHQLIKERLLIQEEVPNLIKEQV